MDARLEIPPAPFAAVAALAADLGCSDALAQVLVRRGFADPDGRAGLAGRRRCARPARASAAWPRPPRRSCAHVDAGSRIVVHGDYDVDGVCSTAILVRVLRDARRRRRLVPAEPHRRRLRPALATVDRLAARGTALLITVDCGITAVGEVAAARAAGLDVVVTDHHTPRADGALPDAPIVHPRVGGYPCPDLCAAGVAYLLARALLARRRARPGRADADLDLVALATVADCVPLRRREPPPRARRAARAGRDARDRACAR